MAVKTAVKVGPGLRVGMLTVCGATEERRGGYTVWRCRCDCGQEVLLDTRALQRGTVRDCGCRSRAGAGQLDLTGQRFGRLVCLEPTSKRGPSGGVVWRCRCDCGNECTAVSTQLKSGKKKSCGCLGRPPVKDYIGRRFGGLVVTGYLGKRDGQHMWLCRCDCGQETEVSQSNLESGHTKSCGCVQRRMGRENMKLVEGTSVAMIENRMKTTIKSNTSGYNGVYYNRKRGLWAAQITFKGRTFYLGSYRTVEEAAHARRRGEEMYTDFLEWYHGELEKAGK